MGFLLCFSKVLRPRRDFYKKDHSMINKNKLKIHCSGSNLVVAVPTPLSVPPTNMQEVTPCQSGVATSSDRPTTAPSNSKDLPADIQFRGANYGIALY